MVEWRAYKVSELAPGFIDKSTLTWEDRLFFAAHSEKMQGLMDLTQGGKTDKISEQEIAYYGEDLTDRICAETLSEWGLGNEDIGRLIVEAAHAHPESVNNE
jgi:hypothetical protein